jgi:vitamin B12 transporter
MNAKRRKKGPGAVWLASALIVSVAAAQGPAHTPPASGTTAPGGSAPADVVAPRLIHFVSAVAPASAVDPGPSPVIVMTLSIDASGAVTAADVVPSGRPELDAAAQAAALGFRFTPALKSGKAVPSRIRYAYRFAPEAPAPASDPTAPSVPFEDAAPPPELVEQPGVPPSAAAAPPSAPPPSTARSDEPPSPSAAPPSASSGPGIEVVVRGSSIGERLRESSRAVKVIDTTSARRHAGDVAEVLSRTEGVAVQRTGGLGSSSRVSLHGLSDDQVRIFVDSVPLELSGFGFGLTSVPLEWVERIEVYRGVVPIRLGTDALGGAIDLVTQREVRAPEVVGSITAGSFDTQQLALNARTRDVESGFVASAAAFYDHSDNDYWVDVQVPNELGQLRPARVRRFHDAYDAVGASVEAGWVERPWARRLLLKLFATDFDKELQHNVNMTAPYGEVTYGQTALGGNLRYDQPRLTSTGLGASLMLGYGQRRIEFRDVSPFVYDWFGNRVFERTAGSGELSPFASDVTQREHRVMGRASLLQRLGKGHRLELVATPDFTTRSGAERLRQRAERIDPLTTRRNLGQLVAGLEHTLTDEDDRVENNLFGKYYLYALSTDQVQTFDNSVRRVDDTTHRFGAGDGLRVRLSEAVLAKASYEFATRLPRPDEVFGDGSLIIPNLELSPESSHNGNIGAQVEQRFPGWLGQWSIEASGFWRHTRDMIVRLPSPDRVHSVHQNVFAVRVLGVDGLLRWSAPNELVTLEGNATLQDLRNVSDSGPFVAFQGDRVPNRPWLFANGTAALNVSDAVTGGDRLSLSWAIHFVGNFQPGWEGTTPADARQQVPDQLIHDLSIGYSMRASCSIDATLDLLNVTDADAFEVLGVQKPGRAAFFKLTACWTGAE